MHSRTYTNISAFMYDRKYNLFCRAELLKKSGLPDGVFNVIVAVILIYFFNPFKKTICNDFHRKVVFSAGIAILLQTSLMQYFDPSTIVKKAIPFNILS